MRALRDRPTALERWTSGVPRGHEAGHRAAGQGRRRVLPEAGAQGRSRLPRVGADHLPQRPHRRGDLPDRDRGAGVVRPHGHPDLPPLAGAPQRRRPPRRAAHRPRPAARHDLRRRRARGRPGRRAAARARAGRLPQDQRQPRHPRLRADPARLGVHRRPPRRDRLRPRAGPPRRRRHGRVVEGGARRADLRRLQPEQPRPHHRLGLLAAAPARRAGLHPGHLGRARRPARPPRLQPLHRPRPPRRRRPVGRASTTRPTPSSRCCSCGRSRARSS